MVDRTGLVWEWDSGLEGYCYLLAERRSLGAIGGRFLGGLDASSTFKYLE